MSRALPQQFLERMKSLLGDDFENFKDALENGSPSQSMFINTAFENAHIPEEFLRSINASRLPFFENGFYFEYEGIGNTPLHHAGAFYVQDPSAMCTVCAAVIKPGTKILDMCASPGGKTLLAAIKTGQHGTVVANEFSVSRCKTLVGNAERMGLSNISVVNTDATDENGLSKDFPETFDIVIADAPCSGEGMFRKYTEQAVSEWSVDNIKLCAARQKSILENAAKCVKPGGFLLYSTCTFSLEENEMQTDAFLCSHPDFSLCGVNDGVKSVTVRAHCFDGCKTPDISLARRFYPHISKGEGQYIALMQKSADSASESVSVPSKKKKNGDVRPSNLLSKEETRALTDFFKGLYPGFDISRAEKYADNIIYVHPNMPRAKKHVFSGGVKLGEVSKGRLIPHHQLFKALGTQFTRIIDLSYDDERVYSYLHGDTFAYDIPDGWCAVSVNGFILGGAKAVTGTVKNHYPKGLRI